MSRAADDTRNACRGYPRGTLLTLQRLGVNLVGMRVYVAGYPGFTWVDRYVGFTGVITQVHEYEWEPVKATVNQPHKLGLQNPRSDGYVNVDVRWDGNPSVFEHEHEHPFALEVLELAA